MNFLCMYKLKYVLKLIFHNLSYLFVLMTGKMKTTDCESRLYNDV